MKWRQPPRPLTEKGEERRVGVEIEFSELSLAEAAEIITGIWGGTLEWVHEQRVKIHTKELGTFTVELDVEWMQKLAELAKGEGPDDMPFASTAGKMLSPLVTSVAPNEIVTPPIPMSRLHELDKLTRAMRLAGAKGTNDSIFYAFGVHLNPELPTLDAPTILRYLRAFFALYDQLKRDMKIDPTRQLTGFARAFPEAYIEQIMRPYYNPDINQLIDDYLKYNPTRNRALDLLPLFAWIDEKRVRAVVTDSLVKIRPTFHFRMPNCRVGDEKWSLAEAWGNWTEVEKLAYNNEKLSSLLQAYA